MKTILIIGAGKSAIDLIDYLLQKSKENSWQLILADKSVDQIKYKIQNFENTFAERINLDNELSRKALIARATVVVSMLPAFLHPIIAQDCIELEKHFFTASYESQELQKLRYEIESKNLFFLNECGLDPGLDHMSAMKIIHDEKQQGNKILSFKSYTGGVLSPESEDNPWKYKFTWNPRNVVLAGQGVSRFIRNGKYKYVPYPMLFKRLERIEFEDVGIFDGYPNRDSLSYRKIYGLQEIPTLLRGTLRREGYCQSWDVFVQLGLTDDSFQMDLPEGFTKRMLINSFLPYHASKSVETKIMEMLPWVTDEILDKIRWLGMLSHEMLELRTGSPATILQNILEEKWSLKPNDKDMIVMQHQFVIGTPTGEKTITSSLVAKGKDQTYTAMAKTVGLPLAIAVEMFMKDEIKLTGLHLPVLPEIYEPILSELANNGIHFQEKTSQLT